MKAQEYLKQIEKLNAMIENKKVEAEQWRDIAGSMTSGGKSVLVEVEGKMELQNMERVQSSGNPSKMSDAIAEAVALEAEANRIRAELIERKQEIIRTIEMLNASQYDVLHKVYIQGKSFKEVAAAKDRSVSWVKDVHKQALLSLQEILDKMDV